MDQALLQEAPAVADEMDGMQIRIHGIDGEVQAVFPWRERHEALALAREIGAYWRVAPEDFCAHDRYQIVVPEPEESSQGALIPVPGAVLVLRLQWVLDKHGEPIPIWPIVREFACGDREQDIERAFAFVTTFGGHLVTAQ